MPAKLIENTSLTLVAFWAIASLPLSQTFAASTGNTPQVHQSHTKLTGISVKDYQITRDSELGNAQYYCIRNLKKTAGDVAIWDISASGIERNRRNGSYSFECDVAYFETDAQLERSLLFKIENALDYLPVETQSKDPPSNGHKLILKVSRLTKPPFLSVSVENIEPNEPLPEILFPHTRKLVTLRLGSKSETPNEIDFSLGSVDSNEAPTALFELTLRLPPQDQPGPFKETPALHISSLFPSGLNWQTHPHTDLYLKPAYSALRFPKDFGWAVATSAHQIEGGNTKNDWYEYERIPGKIFQGHKNENGPDHWNRIAQDVHILKEMGVKQYRMSIEWSRLETAPGVWDKKATQQYRKEILLLEKNGIEPIITLWHSTLPSWVAAKTGWEWDEIGEAFTRFALYTQKHISPKSKKWITLNEPLLYLMGAYIRGVVPPAKKGSFENIKTPLTQMLKAHAQVYKAFHAKNAPKGLEVGIAHRMDIFAPYQEKSVMDGFLARHAENVFNWAIPNALLTGVLKVSIPYVTDFEVSIPELQNTQDFYGLNYYTRFGLSAQLMPFDIQDRPIPGTQEVTDMGWEIYPEGLYILLSQIRSKFNQLPIMITENGIADSSDRLRPKYIRRHLTYLYYALQKQIPVTNYSHWSLYDNLEWDQGFSIQCGLYETNYSTLERIPRKSARFYQKVIKENGISY